MSQTDTEIRRKTFPIRLIFLLAVLLIAMVAVIVWIYG
jgi:hypothetical protein